MKKNFNCNTTNNDEWLTPIEIIESLGKFDLDPCSPVVRPWDTASLHYTVHDDGLKQKWEGRVWLNPPYGKHTFTWLDRLSDHKSGVALIFARTETIGFHKTVWNKAHSVFFFKGRIHFYSVLGVRGQPANAPSCLVSYSENDTSIIENSGLSGRIVIL